MREEAGLEAGAGTAAGRASAGWGVGEAAGHGSRCGAGYLAGTSLRRCRSRAEIGGAWPQGHDASPPLPAPPLSGPIWWQAVSKEVRFQ